MNNKQITAESVGTKKSYCAPTYEIDKFTIYCEVTASQGGMGGDNEF